MLISLCQMDYIYLVETLETQHRITRLKQPGCWFILTAPEHLCPWGLVGYICGFQGYQECAGKLKEIGLIEMDVIMMKE